MLVPVSSANRAMRLELVKSEVDEVSEGAAPTGPEGVPISSGNAGSWDSGAETAATAALATVLMP